MIKMPSFAKRKQLLLLQKKGVFLRKLYKKTIPYFDEK